MNITKTTIKVQASFNYQVASMEVEVEGYTEEELQGYTQYLVNSCSNTVKSISNAVGPTHTGQPTQQKPAVQTQIQRPAAQAPYQPKSQYGAPQAPRAQYQPAPASGSNVRFASEKQIQYLRSFGWQGNAQGLTWSDADTLLKQYKGEI